MKSILKVQNLTKIYKNQSVPSLNNISFEIEQGEFIGLMGASGSGKTTLLNVSSTIDKPSKGRVIIDNIEIQNFNSYKASNFRKDKLGFVFQEYFLLDSLTAYENIAVPLTLLKTAPKKIELEIIKLAKILGISEILNKYPKDMSGGQRQRVAIARAIIKQPPLIFADEPTGALDSASSTEVLKTLQNAIHQLNTTILMVTHDPYSASYTNRIFYFRDGKIISELNRNGKNRNEFYNMIMNEFLKQDLNREDVQNVI
ncbi:bacitracin ABC transporter ATP-binding protein [Candidatus Epulonipiscioides gigas]|nr:bacitracin ABC transporter ATP-binding protein [Epulopiscium sp. SCG-C07WGA-EpuloA2]